MNTEVIVTCAITGAGDTVGKHPAIPVTPKQIADSAIEAAKSGATICHMHVRDPQTGEMSNVWVTLAMIRRGKCRLPPNAVPPPLRRPSFLHNPFSRSPLVACVARPLTSVS